MSDWWVSHTSAYSIRRTWGRSSINALWVIQCRKSIRSNFYWLAWSTLRPSWLMSQHYVTSSQYHCRTWLMSHSFTVDTDTFANSDYSVSTMHKWARFAKHSVFNQCSHLNFQHASWITMHVTYGLQFSYLWFERELVKERPLRTICLLIP